MISVKNHPVVNPNHHITKPDYSIAVYLAEVFGYCKVALVCVSNIVR